MIRREFIDYTSIILGGLFLKSFKGLALTNSIKFGVITDLHFAPKGPKSNNNRYYNESLNKLSEFVGVMNDQQVNFIIELGDFKDQDNLPTEENTLKYLLQIENELKKFNGPIHHVIGNHDVDSISKQQFQNNITNTGQSKTKNYYSFDDQGFHFIVLDANYTSEGKEYNRGNFDWKDSFIPQIQMKWLKKDLDRANYPSVIFVHQRLDYSERVKAHCIKNSYEIQSIIDKSKKVLLVVQGHYHQGDLNKINEVVYLTVKAAVEGTGPENNNYGIIEIDLNNYMKLIGFRKTQSQRL